MRVWRAWRKLTGGTKTRTGTDERGRYATARFILSGKDILRRLCNQREIDMFRLRPASCFIRIALIAFLFHTPQALAEDWPTYQHDNQRSGATGEALTLPLQESWKYRAAQPPQPAWPAPAKIDFARDSTDPLRPRETYDRAYHAVVANDSLFFASSSENKVCALSAYSGELRWTFYTEAPVRLAPAVDGGRVYFGADDGRVYCLSASHGQPLWIREPDPRSRLIPGNGRLISTQPVRSGVLVENGVAYFCAGIFPEEGVRVLAVDAATGAERWNTATDPQAFMNSFTGGKRTARQFALSPQGFLLASASTLFLPTGRTSPAAVDRKSGEILGVFDCGVGEGGAYALVADDTLVNGPGFQLNAFRAGTREKVAAFKGRCLIVREETSYLLKDDAVTALDRAQYAKVQAERTELSERVGVLQKKMAALDPAKEKPARGENPKRLKRELDDVQKQLDGLKNREYTWSTPCGESFAMILAGETLYVGGVASVAAYDARSGKEVWSAPVEGNVYGLAVARRRLYASTDQGVIHCFMSAEILQCTVGAVLPATGTPAAQEGPDYAGAARQILETSGVTRGYCLDLGCGRGQLALELARQSKDLQIIAVDPDATNAAAAREALDRAGFYGARVSVLQRPLDATRITANLANLLISGASVAGKPPALAEAEINRLLRPYGGVAMLAKEGGGWNVLRDGAPDGAGDWTHAYANPGNTACSGDTLANGPWQLQWFGLPGPRPMADRHHRAMPPLAQNGRLFVAADNAVIAADAYNGTPLWQIDVPNSRRLAAPRDAGHLAVNEESLYAVTGSECWVIDVATGARTATFAAPQLPEGEKHAWGYLATQGGALFGSGRKESAAYTQMSLLGDFEIQWGDNKRMIVSDYLFALDRKSGAPRWTYKQGIIINPAIAMDAARLYFVESHSPQALADTTGKVTLEVLGQQEPQLVALDAGTGAVVWEKPIDLAHYRHILYLSVTDGVVLMTGSENRENRAWYNLAAFRAEDGAPLWQAGHPNGNCGVNGDHGEQIHHPVIARGIVFAEPVAYDLHNGARVTPLGAPGEWTLPPREGCGTLSASASTLYFRDGHPCALNLAADENGALSKGVRLNTIARTGCWINMVPADGLLLIPEASSGCSCPYPLQASFAYVPRAGSLQSDR